MPPTATPAASTAGAAPVWVGERLSGTLYAGRVVHAGEDAVYVDAGDVVIGVISRRATPIPCAISTRAASVRTLLGGRLPAVGSTVSLGGGALDFGPHRVRVGRYLDFTMRSFDRALAPLLAQRLTDSTEMTTNSHEVEPELQTLLRTRPVASLDRLLGRGSGLTPFGDDVVCGFLATLLSTDDSCASALHQEVDTLAPTRTTLLSATLLRRAGARDVLPAFADLVNALLRHPDAVDARIDRLLHVGHTSGAGMLLGLKLALDHINTRSCP